MRFHQPLNEVLGSDSRVRILRFFCRKGGEWSGRRIAGELAMNPVTTHRALRALHQATVLDLRRAGGTFLYSLRDGHDLVQDVLRPLFQREAQAHERLREFLKQGLDARLRSHVVSVAIYGSIARRQERPTSDVDCLVLVDSEEAKPRVRQALDRLGETAVNRFGNPLALYMNTVREAQQKARRRLPVFENILKHHQLVWGRPIEEVLRGRPA